MGCSKYNILLCLKTCFFCLTLVLCAPRGNHIKKLSPKPSNGWLRVCYYSNWAQYRPGKGKYVPENIPLDLCTHLVYAFATMESNKIKAFEWNDESTDWMTGMFVKFTDLKKKQPGLKTLLGVGGWNFGTKMMTDMLKTQATRMEFINSTVHMLRKWNFDGIDLDFEYPAARGSPPEDKDRFSKLVQEMLHAYEEESKTTNQARLLITAAVAAGKSNIDAGYDIPSITRHLDIINLMSYDFHGKWESETGHHSPLYAHSKEQQNQTHLNLAFAANYWLSKGADPQKMTIGLPLYGRTFTLRKAEDFGIGAAASGGGKEGKFTREEGYLAYYEVCQMFGEGAQRHWLSDQQVPYMVKGDQWVGFENDESLRLKVQWTKSSGFGGIMVWAVDLDDFAGMCPGERRYPLLKTIYEELEQKNAPEDGSTSNKQPVDLNAHELSNVQSKVTPPLSSVSQTKNYQQTNSRNANVSPAVQQQTTHNTRQQIIHNAVQPNTFPLPSAGEHLSPPPTQHQAVSSIPHQTSPFATYQAPVGGYVSYSQHHAKQSALAPHRQFNSPAYFKSAVSPIQEPASAAAGAFVPIAVQPQNSGSSTALVPIQLIGTDGRPLTSFQLSIVLDPPQEQAEHKQQKASAATASLKEAGEAEQVDDLGSFKCTGQADGHYYHVNICDKFISCLDGQRYQRTCYATNNLSPVGTLCEYIRNRPTSSCHKKLTYSLPKQALHYSNTKQIPSSLGLPFQQIKSSNRYATSLGSALDNNYQASINQAYGHLLDSDGRTKGSRQDYSNLDLNDLAAKFMLDDNYDDTDYDGSLQGDNNQEDIENSQAIAARHLHHNKRKKVSRKFPIPELEHQDNEFLNYLLHRTGFVDNKK